MKKCRRLTMGFALSLGAIGSPEAEFSNNPDKAPFWLSIHRDFSVDRQVERWIAEESSLVILRAGARSAEDVDKYRALVKGIQSAGDDTEVLLYSSANFHIAGGDIGDWSMRWLSGAPELSVSASSGKTMHSFGDVTSPEYRRRASNALFSAVQSTGTDGLAIDLAFRTPNAKPKHLALKCREEVGFCGRYAAGMDQLVANLKKELKGQPLIYNGIWNFGADVPEDQMRLLNYSDAAIVEYFGMNPRREERSFERDILPYLSVMQDLPEGKSLLVFGRGPWSYQGYHQDYLWQRYLYTSYLLAAGNNTHFKYHASFQVPTHAGRTGGLDTYSDWNIPLGAAEGTYKRDGDILYRKFENGIVLVAPEGSNGGDFELRERLYSPEGVSYQGHISLDAGQALLLIDAESDDGAEGSREVRISDMASWPNVAWGGSEEAEARRFLRVDPLGSSRDAGKHDVMLEKQRSLNSVFSQLVVMARARDDAAMLLAVAEVDDPERDVNHVVVSSCINGDHELTSGTMPVFRSSTDRGKNPRHVPYLDGPRFAAGGGWQEITFDSRVVEFEPYEFRGWRYMRIVGSMDVERISLQK